jgi:hypothetical protein
VRQHAGQGNCRQPVDVIVKHWEDYTGLKATREADGLAFADLAPQFQVIDESLVGSEI